MERDATSKTTANQAEEIVSDFEQAIEPCGFGIYNVSLIFVTLLVVSSTIFEVAAMSYILPTLECDFRLTIFDKGLLNAITYAGMIVPAMLWGFVADTIGRKWVLIWGLELNAFCVLLSSLSQKLWQTVVLKFFGGFITCGPFAVIMSYVSESHGWKHRSRVMMTTGALITTANLALPTLAYIILSHHISFNFLGLRIHSWNLFLAATALPALTSGIILIFFPESPKFLLSQGRNEEALQVFRRIYRLNTRNKEDTYPIQSFRVEGHMRVVGSKKERFINFLKQSRILLKTMCSYPFLWLTIRFYILFCSMMMSTNTVRLWLPQLFASFAQAKVQDKTIRNMCDLFQFNIEHTNRTSKSLAEDCDVHPSPNSYINNIFVALAAFIGYGLAIALVRYMGSKLILNVCLVCSMLCGIMLYWSTSDKILLAIACIFMTSSGVGFTTSTNLIVEIFPTSIRTMVVIASLTFGRVGALIGHLSFPLLISWDCMPPFIYIFCASLSAIIMSLIIPTESTGTVK